MCKVQETHCVALDSQMNSAVLNMVPVEVTVWALGKGSLEKMFLSSPSLHFKVGLKEYKDLEEKPTISSQFLFF